jgi:phage baseplate assembly protein W
VPPKAEALQELIDAGFQRAVHWIPSANRSVVEPALQRWEAAIAQVTGEG